MAASRITTSSTGWKHHTVQPKSSAKSRRSAADSNGGLDIFLQTLSDSGTVQLLERGEASTGGVRRGAPASALTLDVTAQEGEQLILMAQHASGAITFHVGNEVGGGRRGAGKSRRSLQFSIVTNSATLGQSARRGFLDKLLKTFLFKVVSKIAGKVADFVLETLSARWEKHAWSKPTHPQLGWVAVSKAGLATDQPVLASAVVAQISTDPSKRNLLFIHGTFSSTEGAFRHLASTQGAGGQDFFARMSAIYEDRIFGFNHFTLSEAPEENALRLLDGLPTQGATFDVITHSRGALVLRTLTELGAQLGPKASRFRIGKVVFIAATNDGTTLANPDRWKAITTWYANIMEVFPDNPFTTFASFLGEALGWMAQHVAGALPGLAAMDPNGPTIKTLQAGSTIPANSYLSLSSNFEPDQWLARMADAGVDAFYASANDLVVQTDSGWRVDPGGATAITGQQIGCFGPGGNIIAQPGDAVHHINFFSHGSTVDFLVNALLGAPLGLPALDPATVLPFRGARRGGTVTVPLPVREKPVPSIQPSIDLRPETNGTLPIGKPLPPADEMFSLFVLSTSPDEEKPDSRSMVASFRNARVVVDYQSRGGDVGGRWQKIIGYHERIKNYIDGIGEANSLPSNGEMIEFGKALFEALFPGDVRRLYDAARAELGRRRLNISLTSMVPWIADKPWEFAYDPTRHTYICAEEVNLVRNVLTAVPADALQPHNRMLRILVVAAQPVGLTPLSVDDEIEVIHRAFRFLEERGLAQVEVIRAASPADLHRRLEQADFADDEIDILHFIGHGAYDRETRRGLLFFEDGNGAVQELDAETLRQIVCRRRIRLVFLNACETGVGYAGAGRSNSVQNLNFTNGIAPSLVAGGVPAVVANQYKVLDVSATGFAENFYLMLARGRSIGVAAREARIASKYLISGESIDWAVPVLFARNPDDVLTTNKEVSIPTTDQSAAGKANVVRGSRRSSLRRTRVGIWDVNRILPNLEKMTQRLNECQSGYLFQGIDTSAPIGSWRAVRRKGHSIGYLNADEIVKRFAKLPAATGVDQLLCVTDLPLEGGGWQNLYGYYDYESKIGCFSLAGIVEEIFDAGLSLEKAIANGLVSGLSGITHHRSGSKHCPAYFNAEREVKLIAGKLTFCKACAKRLRDNPSLNEEKKQSLTNLLSAY
jgi:CHAT domain